LLELSLQAVLPGMVSQFRAEMGWTSSALIGYPLVMQSRGRSWIFRESAKKFFLPLDVLNVLTPEAMLLAISFGLNRSW
jgi:hypothetical protein